MNLAICGPIGVGKSTVSQKYSDLSELKYLNFDKLGEIDMLRRKSHGKSPYSKTGLNLRSCLPPLLKKLKSNFILDFGGSNIFYKGADNSDRLNQILWMKNEFLINVILLKANKQVLHNRFISSNRNIENYEEIWVIWLHYEKPFWDKCADFIIDTTLLSLNDSCAYIDEFVRDISLKY